MNEHLRRLTFVRTVKSQHIAGNDPSAAIAYAQGQGWANVHGVTSRLKSRQT